MTSNFITDFMYFGHIPNHYDTLLINRLSKSTYEIPTETDQPAQLTYSQVMDLPDYLQLTISGHRKALAFKKIALDQGYLVDLKRFDGIEDLLAKHLNRNTRKNLRAKIKKLNLNHDITYKFYYGAIEREQYDFLFEECHRLMKARFDQKSIHNRYLLNWDFYHKLFYPKILSKEASMTVIYDGAKPITITLNFHKQDLVLSFIQIFDIDYSRYTMGDVAMYKNLEWSYASDFTIWDVSKGKTPNKERWCNYQYRYECHIFYDSSSVSSRFKLKLKTTLVKTKQLLRQKGVIGGFFQLDRLYYYLNKNKVKQMQWRVKDTLH